MSNRFIDERLSNTKVLQRLYEVRGHLVEMSFIKAHRKEAVMLRLHVRTNVHISRDAVGECQSHELFLVRLENIQGHTNEELLKVLVHDKSCIEFVDSGLESWLSTNPLKEMGLLLLLLLLLFFVLLGVGSTLLKDGPERRDDCNGLVDKFLLDTHAVERGDEMSCYRIEMHFI